MPAGSGECGADVGFSADVVGSELSPAPLGLAGPSDGVEQREPPAGTDDTGEFGESGYRIGHVREQARGEYRINGGCGER